MREPDEILIGLADEVQRAAMQMAATAELLSPVLAIFGADHQTHRYLIKTPDVHPADVMRVLIFFHKATHAAICAEGWAYEASYAGLDPAQIERMKRTGEMPPGYIRPSQHPDRFDVLNLTGQGPDGQMLYRQWRIVDGSPRTFEEQTYGAAELAPSNYWPMFAPYEEVRRLIREYAELARLRDDVRSRRS